MYACWTLPPNQRKKIFAQKLKVLTYSKKRDSGILFKLLKKCLPFQIATCSEYFYAIKQMRHKCCLVSYFTCCWMCRKLVLAFWLIFNRVDAISMGDNVMPYRPCLTDPQEGVVLEASRSTLPQVGSRQKEKEQCKHRWTCA